MSPLDPLEILQVIGYSIGALLALWIAYVLGLIAVTELLIASKSRNRSERRIMRTLAASFIGIGVVIFAALAAGVGEGTIAGLYLKTITNLGSLLPSVL